MCIPEVMKLANYNQTNIFLPITIGDRDERKQLLMTFKLHQWVFDQI
jgi:hypothetical protein